MSHLGNLAVMPRTRRGLVLFWTAIMVMTLVLQSVAAAAPRGALATGQKVTLCHATNSETNPYRVITVDIAAAGLHNSGHDGHTGPIWYPGAKAAGESAVLAEFPDAVILRPSIIFGPEDAIFNRFADMARKAPLLPLIGGGRTRFQPVYAGDVALAIVAAIQDKAKPGTIYELGGPEVVTFRKLLDRTQEMAGRNRGYLRLPFWAAKLGAALTAPLPNALRPLTVDQVRMLQSDNIVSEAAQKEGRTLQGLGILGPHAIDTIVPVYLEQYRAKGQYSHYRG